MYSIDGYMKYNNGKGWKTESISEMFETHEEMLDHIAEIEKKLSSHKSFELDIKFDKPS